MICTLVVFGCALPLVAQEALVFSVTENEVLLDGGGGNVRSAELRSSELAGVLPLPGGSSARPFLTDDAQWAYLGDFDADGTFVDDALLGPGGAIDAVFVPRFGAAAGADGPRDVYVSRAGETDLGPSARDGDVFRFSTQGSILIFLNEVDLAAGIPGVTDFDLDALAQSEAGDLFFSVSDDALGALGTDGSIFCVDAADVFYGPGDVVLGVTSGSVREIATEGDVVAMIVNSGMRSVTGLVPDLADIDLSALELDPNGGTWTSPVDGQAYPSLWFSWDDEEADGAVLSTLGGGSIAFFGAAPLASAASTTGERIGLSPGLDGVSGLGGLARINSTGPPLVVENFPTSAFGPNPSLFVRQEVAGATPGGAVFFFWDVVSNAPGAVAPVVPLPVGLFGELLGDATVQLLGSDFADANGYASLSSTLPISVVGSNFHVIQQVYDLSTATFGGAAPMDF